MRRLAVMVLMCVSSLQCSFGTDTVEMKTGERVEGLFKQATVAGVVIELGGQSITIPLDKVRAIYFGTIGATTTPSPPARVGEALNALRALQSITGSTASFRDYAPRVLEAKIQVDAYMRDSSADPPGLRTAIGLAMREYELASRVWDAEFPGHADSATWRDIEANLDPGISRVCPAAKDAVSNVRLDVALRNLGASNVPGPTHQPGYVALWKCAAEQLAEAERLRTRH